MVETQSAVEIIVDVAGVPAQALRVLFRGDTLIVAGEKAPAAATAEPTFHLVEREFGRFARAVRLTGAFDLPARTRVTRRGRADDRPAATRGPPRSGAHDPGDVTRGPPAMNILFIGDIVGRPGRELIRKGLRGLVERHSVDLVIANAENSANGFGITKDIGDTLLELGVHVMTSGNHIWDKKEALDYIATEPRLLRPANYPAGVPGRGSYVAQTGDGRSVGVINVMGRVFMTPIDDPFAVVLREIEAIRHKTRVIVVDFHAEATSEKVAMGWHLDGKVTLVVGTHTHVQTADERILPNGTGLHDRLRHDRSARFDHRDGARAVAGAVSHRAADEVRAGHRQPALEWLRGDCRRQDRPRDGHHAHQLFRRRSRRR